MGNGATSATDARAPQQRAGRRASNVVTSASACARLTVANHADFGGARCRGAGMQRAQVERRNAVQALLGGLEAVGVAAVHRLGKCARGYGARAGVGLLARRSAWGGRATTAHRGTAG